MPEVKSKKSKAPTAENAAARRAAADKSLEERIAARKQKSSEKPTPSPVAVAEVPEEQLPFVPNVEQPKAEAPVKEKRKAIRKPKAEAAAPTGVGDIVAKIEARVSARIEKVHSQQTKALVKDHAATIKQLKAEHKASMKNCTAQMFDARKKLVEEAEKKAYAAGLKAGEKAATKSITAALKGR
jgi:hypothetical protein